MKKIFSYICLTLFSAAAFAAPSGIDLPEITGKLDLTSEELAGRLALADSRYRLLISTPTVSADAYAEYRGALAETGGEIRAFSEYRKDISEMVEKLEKEEPPPDDLRELLDLKAYADEKAEALKGRYAEERGKLAQLEEKMRSAAYGQPGSPNADPRAIEKEKAQQLKALEKARAMGDKEKEFTAIRQFSGMDPQKGGQLMSSFFDGLSPQERGRYAEQLKTDLLAYKGRSAALPLTARGPSALARPMGAVVPGLGGSPVKAPAAEVSKPRQDKVGKPLVSNDVKLGVWSAVDKFSPELAAPQLREAKLGIAADAKTGWLEKKRQSFLDLAGKSGDPAEKERYAAVAGSIEKLMGKKAAAEGLDGVDQRAGALGEWNTNVSRLMDNSQEGQAERALVDKRAEFEAGYAGLKTDAERAEWLRKHGQDYDESGSKLADFYVNNPEYLKARKTEADAQLFMRSNMSKFKDGSEFMSDELGLQLPPGQKVSISRVPPGAVDGARGISYKDDKGLSHFQSFDDQVRVNEVLDPSGEKRSIEQRLAKDGTVNVVERRPGGQLFRTEERRPDGTVAMEIYGADGKAVASRVKKPDGSVIEAAVLDNEGIKRTIFTGADGTRTFALESLSGEGGYPRQSGRVVDGRLVMDKLELDAKTVKARSGDYVFETKIDGKSAGFEVDVPALKLLPEGQRGEAAGAAAAIMTGGNAEQAGPLRQFISTVYQQGRPEDRITIVTGRDDKGNTVYQANIQADGYQKQVLGQWTKVPKAESGGLASDVALNISVRSAGKGEDISKRDYLKLFRYSGENVTDRFSADSRTTGNWFTGYGAEADNYIHRYNSDTKAPIKNIKTGTENLFSSPGIIGQTGIAVGNLGKGSVQLVGAGMAGAGALTIGWADKDLQNEFVERAKANFYGNEVSRSLGQNFIGDRYNEGYSQLAVKEDRNIQNVGREMASMGSPTLGAVLQGGVEFSNGMATTALMAPLGGPLSGAVSKTGKVGAVAGDAYSAYKTVKGVYSAGASGVEFVQSYRAFDENDPASKERYYSAVTGLTASTLNAPKTLGRAFKLADNVKDLKNTLTAKGPSPILGADGKPYVKPPEELSSFNRFITGRNEPGVLTRVLTKDISGGLDPKININLANNPVSNAVNSAERWASAKVDRWMGKPVATPRPGLIIPGQVQPNPDARIIIPGQAVPNPDAKIIAPGAAAGSGLDKEAKIWLPGQAAPNPGARIIVPGETVPNPDAQIILPGQ